jgi:hypothetical protein
MTKNPRHKALLMIGTVLFVAAPFAAYFSPRLLSPMLCPLFIEESYYKPFFYDTYKCSGVDFWTFLTVLIGFAIIGGVLILYSLKQPSK